MIVGNFATIDEHRIYVRIDTYNTPNQLPTINIDNSNNIRFADSPVLISESQDSLDSPLYLSQAVVSFLCKDNTIIDHIMELSQYDKVGISIDDMTSHTIIFNGIVEVKTFNQDYAESWTQIDINAYDYMTTLENYKYKDWINWNDASKTATNKTIREIITSLFNNIGYNYHQTFHIYYDNSISVDGRTSILDCIFNEHIFYGDDPDDAMNRQEIFIEILKYFNLTARQLDNRIYIYSAPAQGTVQFTRIDDSTLHTSINFSNVNVQAATYHGTDTQISYEEPKKSYTLSVELDMITNLYEDILSSDTTQSPYPYYTLISRLQNKENNMSGIFGRMILPSNWTLRYYDRYNSTVNNVSDLVEHDNANIAINAVKPFIAANWLTLFPFCSQMGSLELREKLGYYYWGRSVSYEDSLIFKTDFPWDYCENINVTYQPIIDAITNTYNAGGMMELNSLDIYQLTPSNPNITNYLVFKGEVKYSTPSKSAVETTLASGDNIHARSYLLNENNQIVRVMYDKILDGWMTGRTTTNHANSAWGSWNTEIDYNYQFCDNTYPTDETLYTVAAPNTPIVGSPFFKLSGNNYKTYNYINYNANKSEEEEIKTGRQTFRGLSGFDNDSFVPVYDLNDSLVSSTRTELGFNLVKVPVLVCELQVGDKWCVEVPDPNNVGHTKFVWMTQAEATAANITNKTFTIGILPHNGDKLYGNSFSFYCNKISKYIPIDGEAIPITVQDNLSGPTTFKVIQPYIIMNPVKVSGVWQDCTKYNPYAPDCYKWACWFKSKKKANSNSLLCPGLLVDQIQINSFENEIISDNPYVDETVVNTTMVYSNEQPQMPEEYEFKIASGLTQQEYYDNNINTGPAWNYIYNGNNPIMAISNPTYSNIKPEKLYIQRMYDLMNIAPKYISTTLGYENTMNNIYKFTWDPTHTYYPVGCDYDVKLGHKTFNLLAYNPWTNTNNI